MLESLCNRLSRHCSPRSTCSTTSPLSHLHLLPMPLPCSPPLQTSSARSFSRRSSPLSPKLCHALPLKLHNNSLSHSPSANRRSCTCSRRGPPTRRSPGNWWSRSPLPRNMSPVFSANSEQRIGRRPLHMHARALCSNVQRRHRQPDISRIAPIQAKGKVSFWLPSALLFSLRLSTQESILLVSF